MDMGLLKICIGVILTTALENAQYILHLFIGLLVYSVMLLSNFYVFLNLIFREKNNWWILPFIQHPNSSLFLWLCKTFLYLLQYYLQMLAVLFKAIWLFFRKFLSTSTPFYVFLSFLKVFWKTSIKVLDLFGAWFCTGWLKLIF